jgi:hypothetical protein
MIYLGLKNKDKVDIITDYVNLNNTKAVHIIQPIKFQIKLEIEIDYVDYEHAIDYPIFYKLLQEIDDTHLIVLNECLRTQNRNDLTYNCIRHFLRQTDHQIIFNQLPQIDSQNDFMILFDFDSKSQWKRNKFDIDLIKENSNIVVKTPEIMFTAIDVYTQDSTKQKYKAEKYKRFAEIGGKDPDTIPRNLYLIGGKDKLFMNSFLCVARNKRLNSNNVITYGDYSNGYMTILEFPHRFIDFSDFMRKSWQFEYNVLVADLPVDHWYFSRYTEWSKRINETCASLR